MISSFKASGLTQRRIHYIDAGADTSVRIRETAYIIDHDVGGAREQFLFLYPGSVEVEVELIKHLG